MFTKKQKLYEKSTIHFISICYQRPIMGNGKDMR